MFINGWFYQDMTTPYACSRCGGIIEEGKLYFCPAAPTDEEIVLMERLFRMDWAELAFCEACTRYEDFFLWLEARADEQQKARREDEQRMDWKRLGF